jgi:hypothetical protein
VSRGAVQRRWWLLSTCGPALSLMAAAGALNHVPKYSRNHPYSHTHRFRARPIKVRTTGHGQSPAAATQPGSHSAPQRRSLAVFDRVVLWSRLHGTRRRDPAAGPRIRQQRRRRGQRTRGGGQHTRGERRQRLAFWIPLSPAITPRCMAACAHAERAVKPAAITIRSSRRRERLQRDPIILPPPPPPPHPCPLVPPHLSPPTVQRLRPPPQALRVPGAAPAAAGGRGGVLQVKKTGFRGFPLPYSIPLAALSLHRIHIHTCNIQHGPTRQRGGSCRRVVGKGQGREVGDTEGGGKEEGGKLRGEPRRPIGRAGPRRAAGMVSFNGLSCSGAAGGGHAWGDAKLGAWGLRSMQSQKFSTRVPPPAQRRRLGCPAPALLSAERPFVRLSLVSNCLGGEDPRVWAIYTAASAPLTPQPTKGLLLSPESVRKRA